MQGSEGQVRRPPAVIFGVVAIGAGSYSLLSSLVGPALPAIQHDLGASTASVAWVFTAYLLSASVATPITGRLGDMYGKKRVLVPSLAIMAAGAVVSALSHSLGLLIAGRVVQGVGVAVFPLGFGIIRDEFPKDRVAPAVGMLSAIFGIGGAVGIVLAGPIVEYLGYHWIFWIPAIAVGFAALAAYLVIPESPVRSPGSISWGAAGLLTGWLVCILLAVSQAYAWGWGDKKTLGLFAVGAGLLLAWVFVETRSAQPLVDMRMMRRRGVWISNANGLLLGVGMFSSLIVIPEFVETANASGYGFGASVTQAGLFIVPMCAGMPLGAMVAGRLTGTVGARIPLILGGLLTATGFTMIAVAHDQQFELYMATAVMGLGNGFAMTGMANVIFESVPPSQTGVAVGMNTIMRSIGGSIGTQIAATIIAGNLIAGGFPAERGFTIAFAFCACAAITACVLALFAPAPVRVPELELAAALD